MTLKQETGQLELGVNSIVFEDLPASIEDSKLSVLAMHKRSQYTDDCDHQIKIDAGKSSNTILLTPF